MNFVKISDTITEIEGHVRIEPGPPRKREVATEELLSDKATASHYHPPKVVKVKDLGKSFRKPDGSVHVTCNKTGALQIFGPADGDKEVTLYARDALGKAIEVGKPIDFIDWKSRRTPVFYVYRHEEVEVNRGDKKVTIMKWVLKGERPDYAAALTFGTELVAG